MLFDDGPQTLLNMFQMCCLLSMLQAAILYLLKWVTRIELFLRVIPTAHEILQRWY